MAKIDWAGIMDELLVFLRNNITDPNSRGSNQTDEFNGDNSTTTFTLTKKPVWNVSAVTVGGSAQTFGTDYTISYGDTTTATTITFTTAPATGTNNVDVTYHYGISGTWIYPDTPRTDLRLKSLPRIGLITVSGVTSEIGLNASMNRTSLLLSSVVISTDAKAVTDLINDIKDAIIDNKKNFYYFKLIEPVGLGPLILHRESNTEMVQQNIDLEIPWIFES